tara:strand:- start:1821 stop:2555 length:735 start_codon:yes stop_codon:yes gene_type:complete
MKEDNELVNFDGDIKQVIEQIFTLRESNMISALLISLVIIISSIHALDWNYNYYDDAIDAKTAEDWSIEFDIDILTSEHTEVWQDEEVKVIDFFMEDFQLTEGYFIGAINVIIIPEVGDNADLTDPLVQCDAIAADIEVNELTAQWSSDDNNLTGQDSSCENIFLYLQVYPDFTGDNKTSDAPNEFQALMPWNNDGWGEGVLEIKVELDVNSVDQLGPISQDDDEEITIVVEVLTFMPTATNNE